MVKKTEAKQNVLLVGCGDIGIALGAQLIKQGANVWGLRRDTGKLPAGFKGLAADVCDAQSLSVLTGLDFDSVVITLTPGQFTDEAYERVYVRGLANVLAALGEKTPHIFYISSTSVYHQADGDWVDEGSPTSPTSFSGRRLLEAERLLAQSRFSADNKVTIIRFAGIYGPGRYRLIQQVREGKGCAKQPELFTNRIHRDDCVGFLLHLINQKDNQSLENLYIGVDSTPVTMWNLKQWLAKMLNIDSATLTEDAVTRRNSKRCSNKLMLATGYEMRYADFRDGYRSVMLLEQSKL
jgi:nucleoside-diphosphate-sugar epimerase